MDPKKSKIISISLVVVLLATIVILRRFLGQSNAFFASFAACVAAIVAVFIFILYQFTALDRRRVRSMARRMTLERDLYRQEYSFLRKVAGVPVKFKPESLAAATDNFRSVIGKGSTCTVYKGILEDGTAVAVKRIDAAEDTGDGAFRSEVSAIASVQHVNLVRLIGYCLQADGHRFIVYDYIPNGSLNQWIFPGSSPTKCLPWKLRYRVAVDVAKGLAYLQHDCRSRVLHLDVKPENILLDEGFNARVSDFGLSKLMRKDQSRVMTTVRGTRGYLAPEWLLQGGVTEKSDIYSYGLVLFELVGGRRNVAVVEEGGGGERRWSYFPSVVMEREREGRLMEVVDERLRGGGEVEEGELRTMVWVALWCVQEEAKLRPTMARVVDMLEGRIGVERPPETEMLVVDLLSLGETGQACEPRRLPRTPVLSLGSFVSSLSGR